MIKRQSRCQGQTKVGALFVESKETIIMTKKKGIDPVRSAEEEAEKDILKDPELSDSDPTDDLDEGELAQRDNSDEEAFDELEKKRPAHEPHPRPHHPKAKP
jgi:hypothetical protein